MPDIPHFDLPFRFGAGGGHVLCCEQDTLRDVANCAEAIVRTEPGQRIELPGFGMSDPTFLQKGMDVDTLVKTIDKWEPRAQTLIEEEWEPSEFCQDLNVNFVSVDEEPHG